MIKKLNKILNTTLLILVFNASINSMNFINNNNELVPVNLTGFNTYHLQEEPWRILGIAQNASLEEAKKAYRILSRQYHPDKNNGIDTYFQVVKQAFDQFINKDQNTSPLPTLAEEFNTIIRQMKRNGGPGIDHNRKAFFKNIRVWAFLKENSNYNAHNYYNNLNQKAEEVKDIFHNQALFNQKLKAGCSLILSAKPFTFIFNDIITSLNELYRIRTLGSIDPKSISKAATLGKILHIFSILYLPSNYRQAHSSNNIEKNLKIENKLAPINKAVTTARYAQILPSISALKFVRLDNQVKVNADKIAQYNKDTNSDFSKTRLKQYAWLAANKILPYVGFAYLRKTNDSSSLKNIFNFKDLVKQESGLSVQYLEIFKALADISEIARKNYRYKEELASLVNKSNAKVN